MKMRVLAAVAVAGAFSLLAACENQPLARVNVPGPEDQSAYRPVPMPKPLPPDGYSPGMQPPPGFQGGPGQPQGSPAPAGAASGIHNEDIFIAAYAKRSPRMMIFVNRTIQGDSISADNLQRIAHADDSQTNAADYEMIESSMVQYFDNSGKVRVQDSDAARSKLNREQILRIENGDPAANRLLSVELQQDVLIRVTAVPTRQASSGQPSIRLIAKAVSTTDARNLGNASVDMPLPMGKTAVNVFTRYLCEELMGQMAQKWAQPAEYDPIELRIYKAASVDDTLKIRQWLLATKGVKSVRTNGATGSGATSYASFAVAYEGAPEDLYADLRAAIGQSQGLKAVDLQSTTINLEVSGPMNLVTTTRHTETTTETRTTEDRRIEPINPAPIPQQ